MRPTVAVLYDYGAVGPLDIGRAADGIADLLFVMDTRSPHGRAAAEIAAELGTVVDEADTEEVSSALSECAGITTFADSRVVAAARYAGRYGFPYHSESTAFALTDKYIQRSRLSAARLPCPRFRLLPRNTERDEAEHVVSVMLPDVVVKPTRGTGSRSAYRVQGSDAVPGVLDEICGRGGVFPEDFIVEQMWPGTVRRGLFADFVSVETVSVAGRHCHIGVTERLPLQPPLRESGSAVPTRLGEKTRAELLGATHQALDALAVEFGVTHTEFKLTPQGPRIIEVNGRVGGFVDALYRQAGIHRVARAALLAALGAEPEPPAAAVRSAACAILPLPHAGQPDAEAVAVLAKELMGTPGVRHVDTRENGRSGTTIAAGTLSSPLIAWLAAPHAEFDQLVLRVAGRLGIRGLEETKDTRDPGDTVG